MATMFQKAKSVFNKIAPGLGLITVMGATQACAEGAQRREGRVPSQLDTQFAAETPRHDIVHALAGTPLPDPRGLDWGLNHFYHAELLREEFDFYQDVAIEIQRSYADENGCELGLIDSNLKVLRGRLDDIDYHRGEAYTEFEPPAKLMEQCLRHIKADHMEWLKARDKQRYDNKVAIFERYREFYTNTHLPPPALDNRPAPYADSGEVLPEGVRAYPRFDAPFGASSGPTNEFKPRADGPRLIIVDKTIPKPKAPEAPKVEQPKAKAPAPQVAKPKAKPAAKPKPKAKAKPVEKKTEKPSAKDAYNDCMTKCKTICEEICKEDKAESPAAPYLRQRMGQ